MSAVHASPAVGQRTEPWCAGLPRVAARAVTEFERNAVERRIAAARRTNLLILGAIVGVALGTAALVLPGRDPVSGLQLTGLAWAIELGIAGLLSALLSAPGARRTLASVGAAYLLTAAAADRIANHVFGRSLDATLGELTTGVVAAMLLIGLTEAISQGRRRLAVYREIELARADLAGGEPLEQFEGVRFRRSNVQVHRLLSLGVEEGRPGRVDLLPRSGLVVRANGRPVRPWITVPVVQLAPPQLHAYRVDLPAGIARERGHRLQRRGVSPEEVTELRGHARRLIRTGSNPALVCVGAVAYLLARTHLEPRFDLLGADALLWYGAAMTAVLLYAGRFRAALRLREDARVRWLVTVHNAGGSPASAPRMEVLPVSRLIWTEDGGPPRWRITG